MVRLQRGPPATSSAVQNVAGPGAVTIETLPVGRYLIGTLNEAGFNVKGEEPDKRPLATDETDETAEFSWVAAVQITGSRTLRLSLTAEVTLGAATTQP